MQYGAQSTSWVVARPDLLRGTLFDLPHLLEPVQTRASRVTVPVSHYRYLGRDGGAGAILGVDHGLR